MHFITSKLMRLSCKWVTHLIEIIPFLYKSEEITHIHVDTSTCLWLDSLSDLLKRFKLFFLKWLIGKFKWPMQILWLHWVYITFIIIIIIEIWENMLVRNFFCSKNLGLMRQIELFQISPRKLKSLAFTAFLWTEN